MNPHVDTVFSDVVSTDLERTTCTAGDGHRLAIEIAVDIAARRVRRPILSSERYLYPEAVEVGDDLSARSNIVAIEEKKDSESYDSEADAALLSEYEEKELHSRLDELKIRIAPVLAGEYFDDAMDMLAELRQPVDDFFDCITVNCEDGKQRVNRLKLLSQIRAIMGKIADFGKIEG